MNANRDMLEDQMEKYEAQLKSLNSYIKELNDTTAKNGTDRAQFEVDLLEAENNADFYGGEIALLKKELGGLDKSPGTGYGGDTVLPHTVKQGVGSLIFSSISFVAGALFGSKLKSRRSGKETTEKKRES
jgi:hypothetical protein